MPLLAPPRRLLTWTATALGASFGYYGVWRRPSRVPVAAWSRIGKLTVPTGYTAATVEAQHTAFLDLEAGWAYAGGQWEAGWDYYVTVYNASTGLESPVGVPTLTRLTVTPDVQPWLVTNVAPFLSFAVPNFVALGGSDSSNVVVETTPQGRDRALTRTREELPYRTFAVGWRDYDRAGQDGVRPWRAANAIGATMCLHMQHGDRVIGTLQSLDKFDHGKVGDIGYGGKLVETNGEGDYVVADYNLPAGVVLNGTTQYLTTPTSALLNPTGAFSVVVAAAFAGSAGQKYALSKGSLGAADGWAIRTTAVANVLDFRVVGASGSGSCPATDATWFDGRVHVAVGTSSGTAQKLYRDGATTPLGTGFATHGTISNAVAAVVGANNGGASGFMAAAPFQALAYYARELTAAEAQAAAYYLLGYPGYRMPAGAVWFVDLRDARSWNGVSATILDLGDNGLHLSAVASPATRGIPSAFLATIEQAAA